MVKTIASFSKLINQTARSSYGSYSGFGLIEVLIATVILAIGLLGIATLQQKSLLLARDADNYATATMLANEIANRMQVNIVEAKKTVNGDCPAGSPCYSNSVYVNTLASAASASASCYTQVGCSPTLLAATDLADWYRQLQNSLPNSSAVICFDSADSNTMSCNGGNPAPYEIPPVLTFTIKIAWTTATGSPKIFKTKTVIPYTP